MAAWLNDVNHSRVFEARHSGSLEFAEWRSGFLCLIFLIALIVFGNFLVVLAVVCDRKLRTITTNKFIASLAVSDLLVGIVVMPLSLYAKVNNDKWDLGHEWCQFHLVTGVFSTTASIVHLVAISLDRYFAIMFPTEYQRHSISTSALPYAVMIWTMSFAVSSTLFMEKTLDSEGVCWVVNPQYLVLSSFLSFFLPGAIVVFLYVKIFRKLRNHQLYMFGQASLLKRQKSYFSSGGAGEKRRSLPRVIIEEVRSRRGSRLSQTGSNSGSPTRRSSASGSHKSERSPSQPEIHAVTVVQQRWRSPTICAETLAHDRSMAAKKRVSIVPDPPSMDCSSASYSLSMSINEEHLASAAATTADTGDRQKKDVSLPAVTVGRSCLHTRSEEPRVTGLGPAPIMAAFNRAFQEVNRLSERRSSSTALRDPDDHLASHPLLRSHLPTVMDEGSGEKEEESSRSTVIETSLTPSEPSSQRPLLLSADKVRPAEIRKPNTLRVREGGKSLLPSLLNVPTTMAVNTPPASPSAMTTTKEHVPVSLKVPKLWDCPSPTCASVPSSGNSSHSSYTSASGSDETYRRISMNSYGSSLTDGTDSTYEVDSRRSSAWSTLRTAVLAKHLVGGVSFARTSANPNVDASEVASNGNCSPKKMSTISRGKLRRIATQVTRAIRRKRRESMAIRRESRATRVVAAILIAFLICWIPYFCVTVYRGICTGLNIAVNKHLHVQLFVVSSWLGYAHSCFNPVIYMCLNKNFRRTLRKMMCCWRRAKPAKLNQSE